MTAVTVLIVEHDILVRHPLAEYLRQCGYRVLEAVSPTEARECLLDERFNVGVALIDIEIPSESGFALASWMRTNCPTVTVLLGGTLAKVAEHAGDLCEENPSQARPIDYRSVLDHIRQLLAARERNGPADGETKR